MALRATYQDDVLTTIGITVTLKVGTTGNGTEIAGVYSFGDLGADANELDATPLSAAHTIKKPGIIDDPAWELDYYYNDTDYDLVETARGKSATITITMPNGTTYSNTAELASHYLLGATVGGVQQVKTTWTLGNADGWTRTKKS